jgi:tripartite-type tricarboxylate transporter receptor subunit TctC
LLGCVAVMVPAAAQQWPSKPIRVVVAGNAGTPPDTISRIVLNEVAATTGWTFVIENKTGAVQTIAGQEVKRAPADGHSIWLMGLIGTVAPTLAPQSKLDIVIDFVPVTQLSRSYNVLVVHPDVTAASVRDVIEQIKRQPGKLNYMSGGIGTPAHLIGEMFRLQQNLDVAHVRYPQLAQGIQDLLANRVQYGFITTLPMIELIAAGKLRAIAVTAPTRIAALSETPTVVEQGFPELAVADWYGAMMAKGTPAAVVERLNAAFNVALAKPTVSAALSRLGAEAVGGTPLEFGKLVQEEIARWNALLQSAGITPQ